MLNINNENDLYYITRNIEKKNRKTSAIILPNDISNIILPKYVVYHKECYNQNKNLWREFFRIEKHPKINKYISSSKSNKINIKDKLEYIKNILYLIENKTDQSNCIIDQSNCTIDQSNCTIDKIVLPKYISIKLCNNKKYLIYDKKIGKERQSVKIILPENLDTNIINYNINKIYNKLNEKYN